MTITNFGYPISFSSSMVIALLDNRKTQTRRIMKPQPIDGLDGIFERFTCQKGSPYGEVGDLLWVREPWRVIKDYDRFDSKTIMIASGGDMEGCVDYTSTSSNPGWVGRRRHARFMPRWASRMTLELTGVRVERVQGISEADAEEEGCFFTDYGSRCFHEGQGDVASCPAAEEHHQQKPGWMWQPTTSSDQCLGTARHAYGNLWNSINGPDSWDANPWVWVLTFKVHQGNIARFQKGLAA